MVGAGGGAGCVLGLWQDSPRVSGLSWRQLAATPLSPLALSNLIRWKGKDTAGIQKATKSTQIFKYTFPMF